METTVMMPSLQPGKADPPSKNRVWGFSAVTYSCTSANWLQVPDMHREIETTSTTTVSGVVEWLSKDPIGISGGLNQYVFCGNNPVMFVDPLGLYVWQVQYWADLTVNGNTFQKVAGYVFGPLAAMVPDVATIEIRGAVAAGVGISKGTGYLINPGDGSITPYHTTGGVIGSPIAGIGVSVSIAWSSLPSPSASEFMGIFHEVYAGFDFVSVGAYGSPEWFGLSGGIGHDWWVPAFLNYQYVNYQMYDSDPCSN